MRIRYSVIIPAYNAQAYLAEAVESALQQIGISVEIIIVNDGSTDATLEIASSFKAPVKVVDQANKGISGARNSGAAIAEGERLAFLDADDIWLPGKLLAQDGKFADGFRIVYTNRYNFGDIGDAPPIQSALAQMPEGEIWNPLLYGNFITTSSVVIDRGLFGAMNGFREDLRFCEDWDLWLRCAEQNEIGYCPEPYVKYRMHSGGLSKNYRYMNAMRRQVVDSALSSKRAEAISVVKRRKIRASAWSTSGWDAAKARDYRAAAKCYVAALREWPIGYSTWYDVARLICGRI